MKKIGRKITSSDESTDSSKSEKTDTKDAESEKTLEEKKEKEGKDVVDKKSDTEQEKSLVSGETVTESTKKRRRYKPSNESQIRKRLIKEESEASSLSTVNAFGRRFIKEESELGSLSTIKMRRRYNSSGNSEIRRKLLEEESRTESIKDLIELIEDVDKNPRTEEEIRTAIKDDVAPEQKKEEKTEPEFRAFAAEHKETADEHVREDEKKRTEPEVLVIQIKEHGKGDKPDMPSESTAERK